MSLLDWGDLLRSEWSQSFHFGAFGLSGHDAGTDAPMRGAPARALLPFAVLTRKCCVANMYVLSKSCKL